MCTTYTGRLLTKDNYGVPAPLDIAVALGRLPRFCGHTRHWPWTVLHHTFACYGLAKHMLTHGGTPDYRQDDALLAVLLHDAEEAATGDVPTTWKTADLRALQHTLSGRIWAVYSDQNAPQPDWIRRLVKEVDACLLVAEMHEVAHPATAAHAGCDVWAATLRPDYVRQARQCVREAMVWLCAPEHTAQPDGGGPAEFLRLLRKHGAHLTPFHAEETDGQLA